MADVKALVCEALMYVAQSNALSFDYHQVMCDPEGVQSSLMGSVKGPEGEAVPKSKTTFLLHHDETSLRSRRKRDKGHQVYNAERLYVVTSEDAVLPPYRDRKNYGSTTRGEILGPISATSWEEPCHIS